MPIDVSTNAYADVTTPRMRLGVVVCSAAAATGKAKLRQQLAIDDAISAVQ